MIKKTMTATVPSKQLCSLPNSYMVVFGCRSEFKALLSRLGLTGASVPLFLPGDIKFVPLAPDLDAEDRKVMENVTKLGNFLTGGDAAGLIGGSSDPQVMREMLPFLPNVATEIAPEVLRRLASRLSARAVRELFVSSPP